MAKAVLLSIRPRWVEKIIDGRKMVEIRKSYPRIQTPFKCYIYCTMPKYEYEDYILTDWPKPQNFCGGKVVGEFVCDKVYKVIKSGSSYIVDGADRGKTNEVAMESCLGFDEMRKYLGTHTGYAWHISKIQIYDTPRKLEAFERPYDCNNCDAKWATECNECHAENKVKRPPQSWFYVEKLGNE